MRSTRDRKIPTGNADRDSRQPDCSSEARRERANLTEALTELHKLLQDYAPPWYSEEQNKKIKSALNPTKRH
jgi:hypothetical protein